MIDYEALILARQEALEIYEDDPDSDFLSDEDKEYFDNFFAGEE